MKPMGLSSTLANFRCSDAAILQAFPTGGGISYGLGSARDPQENAKNPHISAYFQDCAASKLAEVELRD